MQEQGNINYALVTGASSGIGLALTKQLLKTHHVIAVSRTLGGLGEISSNNLSHWPYDLASNSERIKLIAQANTSLPYLNLLVNNAGVQIKLTLEEFHWDSHQREVSLNLMAPIHLTIGLNSLLLQSPQPKIFNMGSVLGFCHRKVSPMYSISKAAIHRFSQIINADNKQVSLIEFIPPMTATNMTKARGHQGLLSADELAKFMINKLDENGIVYIGKARVAKWLHKLAPRLLSKLINKGEQ